MDSVREKAVYVKPIFELFSHDTLALPVWLEWGIEIG